MNLKICLISLLIHLCTILKKTSPSRILGIIPTPSYSHQNVFRPLWTSLLDRNHHLTLLTTDPLEIHHKNLTQIDLHGAYEILEQNQVYNHINRIDNNAFKFVSLFADIVAQFAEFELSTPEVADLIADGEQQFDLVLIEIAFLAFFPFKERFNCPMIGLTTMEAPFYLHKIMGNPAHPVLYPERALSFYKHLNFKQRLTSVIFQLYVTLYRRFYIIPRHQAIAQKFFNNNNNNNSVIVKRVDELEKEFALIFTNVNPLFQGKRPLGFKIITFGGGVHLQKSTSSTLKREIKLFLDNSPSCVYFSLGSKVKSALLSEDIKSAILGAFRELPQYNFLWKFEATNDLSSALPDNVKIVEWLPQREILSHNNVKLFITQGGLQSIEEAVFYHVPMIALPFYGDQMSNSLKLFDKGIGLYLNHADLTASSLKGAIVEILSNDSYRRRIKEFASISRDLPISGLDKIVWWTEYVIRNKDSEDFNEPERDIPLYQYYLIDVISVVFVFIGTIIYLCVAGFKRILRRAEQRYCANKKID